MLIFQRAEWNWTLTSCLERPKHCLWSHLCTVAIRCSKLSPASAPKAGMPTSGIQNEVSAPAVSQYFKDMAYKEPRSQGGGCQKASESFPFKEGCLVLALSWWYIPQQPNTSPWQTHFLLLGSCWHLQLFHSSVVRFWHVGSQLLEDFFCHQTHWRLFSVRTTLLPDFWWGWRMS